MGNTSSDLATMPQLLARNVARYGDKAAYREKEFGIWQSWTWADASDEIHQIARGFVALGLKEGDGVAIIGRNMPVLYRSMMRK